MDAHDVERHLKRGELKEALRLLDALCKANPGDASLSERLRLLKESIDPAELMNPKSSFAPESASGPGSPEHEGERLFAIGDYAGAAAAYRRALSQKPGSQLIQERLVELFQLAQAAPRASPTDAALPGEREPLLRALLDRISSRRRAGIGS
jgi:tetratricopeptide (TPR) repeat protein